VVRPRRRRECLALLPWLWLLCVGWPKNKKAARGERPEDINDWLVRLYTQQHIVSPGRSSAQANAGAMKAQQHMAPNMLAAETPPMRASAAREPEVLLTVMSVYCVIRECIC
jgi:hypothetical protein